ncbi:MAG: threonine-phosphate decarboxylase CobD [Oleiphilaceae bacterium]|nr:threonine-phosphate decarboxylase CobD [Oleiphilaceae bacterium]
MEHGGRLNQAVRRWGIPVADWLDLSTGINPDPWPVPAIPASCWQRLPEEDDGLETVARRWGGAPGAAGCLPLAGTQAAIQALPGLRAPCRVAVPRPGYAEHGAWWARAGHSVQGYDPADPSALPVDELDVLVCIHPNNPTGDTFTREQLLQWHRRMSARGGWLVVDEAFIDGTGLSSLVPDSGREGLLVMRSMGKFFGLAGARAGLLFAPPALCQRLALQLGPWALSGPARFAMAAALQDVTWQRQQSRALQQRSAALRELLTKQGLPPSGGTLLFQYCAHSRAGAIADALAEQGILVRVFSDPPALRFGLPAGPAGSRRLQQALAQALGHDSID